MFSLVIHAHTHTHTCARAQATAKCRASYRAECRGGLHRFSVDYLNLIGAMGCSNLVGGIILYIFIRKLKEGLLEKGDDLILGPLGHNFSKIMGDNFHIKENFTLLPNYLHTHTHTFLWILIITPLFAKIAIFAAANFNII